MVVASILYALDGGTSGLAVVLLATYFLSYLVPLFLNINRLKVAEFFKGSVFAIFLSPTYVNILTIFAISNIHDVSWGSRPAGGEKLAVAAQTERKKGIMYRDFRSNFLIIWLLLNFTIGFLITWLARNDYNSVILVLGGILSFVIGLKLIFAICFIFKACLDSLLIDRKNGDFFLNSASDRKKLKNIDFRFNVFFQRNLPHKTIILPPNQLPTVRYYGSSIKDENIQFGMSTTKLEELRQTYWSGMRNVIKSGKWNKLKHIFKSQNTNPNNYSDDEEDEEGKR